MSTIDCHFSINLDVCDDRMLDMEEIMAAKIAKHATKNAEGDHADEGTTKLSHSPTIGHTVDEEMENVKDVADM